MQDDWRLTGKTDYLYRAELKKAEFKGSATNDHEHCEFCLNKFGAGEGMLKAGYCTPDEYYWICPECFQDFQKQFEWRLTDD